MAGKFTKEAQIAGGKIQGARSRDAKTGIHGLSEAERLENCRKGGLVQGPIQGKKLVESGHLERIRNLPQTKIALRRVGLAAVKRIYDSGYRGDPTGIATTESRKKGAEIGGPIGRHVRWHVNRGMFNLKCDHCLAALQRKENWGIEIQEPEE
jgi:hypothetical protein